MKKRLLILGALLVTAMLCVGCNGLATDSQGEKESQTSTDSETGEVKNQLSKEKLEWFETSFFNSEEPNMVNMFLTSEYASPADIDLGELFYNGTYGETNVEISDQEEQLLEKQYNGEIDLDISKTTVEDMNALLQKYMKITLEETKKVGLDGLYYLEEHKAYYSIAGDTNWVKCEIQDGWTNDDGTIVIQYVIHEDFGGDGTGYQVTLKEENENYYFVSNLSVK